MLGTVLHQVQFRADLASSGIDAQRFGDKLPGAVGQVSVEVDVAVIVSAGAYGADDQVERIFRIDIVIADDEASFQRVIDILVKQ